MNAPVVVYLADKRDRLDPVGWYRIDCLCASIQTVKLFMPSLPVVIFHEDFLEEDKRRIWNIVPEIKFEQIDFETHRAFHVNCRPDGRCGAYGYTMMCRFFCGVMQAHSAISGYSHYMRLDDDNYIVAPAPESFFNTALSRDYTYACYSEEQHRTLYKFTNDFLAAEGLKHLPPYSDSVPYNNMHIASLALWRHPVIRKYTDKLEEVNGCVALGWTDASIHNMIVKGIAPQLGLKVCLDTTLSYRHNQQCIHKGPHTEYCYDGKNRQYPWGPPSCLSKS